MQGALMFSLRKGRYQHMEFQKIALYEDLDYRETKTLSKFYC